VIAAALREATAEHDSTSVHGGSPRERIVGKVVRIGHAAWEVRLIAWNDRGAGRRRTLRARTIEGLVRAARDAVAQAWATGKTPTPLEVSPVAEVDPPDVHHTTLALAGFDEAPSPPTLIASATEPLRRAVTLEAAASLRLFSRSFDYHQDILQRLHPYSLPVAAAVAVATRWLPVRSHGGLSFGIAGNAVAAVSVESVDAGTVYSTTAYEYEAALTLQDELGAVTLIGMLGAGEQVFELGAAESGPGRGPSMPAVPAVDYRYLRAGGGLRWTVGDRIALEPQAAWLFVFDAGEVASARFFPHLNVSGVDLSLEASYAVSARVALCGGAALRRYFFDLHPRPGDLWIAGGAIDQFIAGTVGLRISI
jgi:hypothetical protein